MSEIKIVFFESLAFKQLKTIIIKKCIVLILVARYDLAGAALFFLFFLAFFGGSSSYKKFLYVFLFYQISCALYSRYCRSIHLLNQFSKLFVYHCYCHCFLFKLYVPNLHQKSRPLHFSSCLMHFLFEIKSNFSLELFHYQLYYTFYLSFSCKNNKFGPFHCLHLI